MPEGEPDTPAQFLLDVHDLAKRLPRVRTFVVAVLDDHVAGWRAAEMSDLLVQRSCAPARVAKVRDLVIDDLTPDGLRALRSASERIVERVDDPSEETASRQIQLRC